MQANNFALSVQTKSKHKLIISELLLEPVAEEPFYISKQEFYHSTQEALRYF